MSWVIGDDNLLMAYTHVAHDVQLGSHCVLANAVTLAGHVIIGDWAVIGAFSGVHQFCRIGRHSMIGGYSVITQDVMPFATIVTPRESKAFGANATAIVNAIDALSKSGTPIVPNILVTGGGGTFEALAATFLQSLSQGVNKS